MMRVINEAGLEILEDIYTGIVPAYPRPGAPHGAPQDGDAAIARVFAFMAQMVGHASGGHATPLAHLFTIQRQGIVHNWIQQNGPGYYEEPWGFLGTYDNPDGPVLQMDCPADEDPGDPGRRRLMTDTWIKGPTPAHPEDLPVAGHWSSCDSGGCTPMLKLYDLYPPSSQCELQHSNVDATCGDEKKSSHSNCMTFMDQHYPNTSCDINAGCRAPSPTPTPSPTPGKKPIIQCNTLNRADCQLASYCHWDTSSSPHSCKSGAPPHPAPAPLHAFNALSPSQCVAANTRCHWDNSAHDDRGGCVPGAALTPAPTPGQEPCKTLNMAGCIQNHPRCHWQERGAGTGGVFCIPGTGPPSPYSGLTQTECTEQKHYCNWVGGRDPHCADGATHRNRYCKQLVDNCNYVNKFVNAYGVCESGYSWKCAGDNTGCNCTWKDNKCQNSSARCQWDSDDKCCKI